MLRLLRQPIILFALTGFAFVCLAADETPPANTRVVVQRTITNGFVHPGIGLTKELLEQARAQTIAAQEPWATLYREMASSPQAARSISIRNESRTQPGRPDVDAFDHRGIQSRLSQDGALAETQALMYFFTGDTAYRANALRVIRVWSGMDPAKYRYYPDAHIHTGYPLKSIVTAAELLRYTSCTDPDLQWTAEDTDRLSRNLVRPMIATFMHSNGWFMNQNNFALLGAMSGCIFTDDRAGYDQRVEWFTVNRDGPNQGWSGSIKQLARRVELNALTGESVPFPQVQLTEMGRDGAHAAEDINLFVNISNMMLAQGTKVDPVAGTVSTATNAVGPYEFLDDRILAVTDYACRFMLGYDTPWIPVAYDIAADGTDRRIYPRLSDQYRGRMTTFGFWYLYFYYTYTRGVDVARVAPHFYEMWRKRITRLDWVYLPVEAAREGTALLLPTAEPGVVPLARRVTVLAGDIAAMREGDREFLRVTTHSGESARFALLTASTPEPLIGLRVRSSGPATLHLAGLATPWPVPDTLGNWIHLILPSPGRPVVFDDIAFVQVQAEPGVRLDLWQLTNSSRTTPAPPVFGPAFPDFPVVVAVGDEIELDLSATGANAYHVDGLPDGARLDSRSGRLQWIATAGRRTLTVAATDGGATSTRQLVLDVVPDHRAMRLALAASYDPRTAYVQATWRSFAAACDAFAGLPTNASNRETVARSLAVQRAAADLEPLTPHLADGSLDYVRTATSPDAGRAIALLADGNDDTFPVYNLAADLDYVLDFGVGFKATFEAFSVEGRLNFEERAAGVAFFGSDDGHSWTRLTTNVTPYATGFARLEVDPEQKKVAYRFLRMAKVVGGGPFEPAELRIDGRRIEPGRPSTTKGQAGGFAPL